MSNTITIHQKKFPFIKKQIDLDLDKNIIKIISKSLFKSNEIEIATNTINENPEKIQKKSIVWFLISIFFTVFLIAWIVAFLWSPPEAHEEIPMIIKQVFLLLWIGYTWIKCVSESYKVTVYTNRYTNQVLFVMYTNNPDKATYDKFIEALTNSIHNEKQRNIITNILVNIPTHILVEEFSTSYMNELINRGVDMQSMMQFLSKKVTLLKS